MTTFSAGSANAATASSNLVISATVIPSCTIATNDVAFGVHDPIVANASADLTGTGSIMTTCTNGIAATVALSQGTHATPGSADAAPLRGMTDFRLLHFPDHPLHTGASHTDAWQGPTGTGAGVLGPGSPNVTAVYGVGMTGQNVSAGNYSDMVTATISF